MSRSSSRTSAGGVCGREPNVTVLGAGIAGLALGYYARRSGIRATLYVIP